MLVIKMQKRGQVTLFIIIAIVIVAIIVLGLIFVPKLFPGGKIPTQAMEPEPYIQDCVNQYLEPDVKDIAQQGGYLEPQNYILYKDVKRAFLCYTNTPYVACVNQEPLLKEHIETELKNNLQQSNAVTSCINKFSEAARKQGYDITVCNSPKFSVNLTEGKVNVPITCQITMTKGQETKTVEKLTPYLKWPLYDFVLTTKEIIDDEISNTDFDPLGYMSMHYWVEIEKYKTSDGSKIYKLKERATGNEFAFAVRNYILPPGIIG